MLASQVNLSSTTCSGGCDGAADQRWTARRRTVTTIKSHENVGMSTYLYRMGRWAFLRRRYVVGFWVVVAIAMVALSVVAGGKTVDDYTVPGQSKEAAQ